MLIMRIVVVYYINIYIYTYSVGVALIFNSNAILFFYAF